MLKVYRAKFGYNYNEHTHFIIMAIMFNFDFAMQISERSDEGRPDGTNDKIYGYVYGKRDIW